MKKKVYVGIGLLGLALLMGALLFRSGGDRSTLLVDGGVLQPDDVYADQYEQPTIDQALIDEVFDTTGFTTQEFVGAYEKALSSHDGYLKLNIAESLYEKTNDPKVLPVLVLLALQHHSIAKALSYIDGASLANPEFINHVGGHTLMRLLLNREKQSLQEIALAKEVVNRIYDLSMISEDDKYYYYSLIALLKGDMTHFEYYMGFLEGSPTYNDWFTRVQKTKTTAAQYEFAPAYFQDGLLGIELFYEGRYAAAKSLGEELVSVDPTYLLGYQLQAYASLFVGEWQRASEMFEHIKQVDNESIYVLLQAIALYHNEVYPESVLLLKQIAASDYAMDAKRYLLLSYDKLGDSQGVMRTIQSMVGYELSPFDYFTIFDTLFFTRDSKYTLTSSDQELIDGLLHQCRQDLAQSHGFVCFYGKAGLLYSVGEYKKALPLMQGLTKWYPTANIYQRIGDIAFSMEEYELAKKSFIQAFAASTDNAELLYLRQRVTSLLAL